MIRTQTDQFRTILAREFRTIRRRRQTWLLAGGVILLFLGISLLSNALGYVPLVLSLQTPVEIIIPVITATIGYRSLLEDRERHEDQLIQTYPVDPLTYVGAIYVARAALVIGIIVGGLLVAGLPVVFLLPETPTLIRTSGFDSPIFYFRFITLSVLYSMSVLAVFMMLSALVSGRQQALIVAVIGVGMITVGLDLALILGLARDFVGGDMLSILLALSPASAYRGLIMTYVVSPVVISTTPAGIPFLNVISLLLWLGISLAIANWRVL
ncbi:MAG: hypothetical protein ABEI06_07330 [Halobacteriaceae archaeon]